MSAVTSELHGVNNEKSGSSLEEQGRAGLAAIRRAIVELVLTLCVPSVSHFTLRGLKFHKGMRQDHNEDLCDIVEA